MIQKLDEAERAGVLAPLLQTGWRMAQGRDAIAKTFRFADFTRAFGWMTQVAIWAEKLDHHPEWTNVYRTVDVVLISHDADGLTGRDIALAQKMDELAG